MLMELERFWSIIEQSLSDFDPDRRDGNMDAQVASLNQILSKLDPKEIGAFSNRLSELFHSAYRWDLWAAGYIIEGGCSDDGFIDFRYWLISMGRTVFENAMADVESLADVAFGPGIEVTRFEEFGYIADQLLRTMGVSETDAEIMAFEHPNSPAGDEWDDDDLPNRFPKLTAAEAQFGA